MWLEDRNETRKQIGDETVKQETVEIEIEKITQETAESIYACRFRLSRYMPPDHDASRPRAAATHGPLDSSPCSGNRGSEALSGRQMLNGLVGGGLAA